MLIKNSSTKKISSIKKLKGLKRESKKKVGWKDVSFNYNVSVAKGVALSPRAHRLLKLKPSLTHDIFLNFLKIQKKRINFSSVGEVSLEKMVTKGSVGNYFFKLGVGKRNFFVKIIENKFVKYNFNPARDLALTQFKVLKDAKTYSKKMPLRLRKHFDVISPEFAFVSGKYSFLVTEFFNLKTVSELINEKKIFVDNSFPPRSLFEEGTIFFKKKLFVDVEPHNIFYDRQQKKFILFDLRKRD